MQLELFTWKGYLTRQIVKVCGATAIPILVQPKCFNDALSNNKPTIFEASRSD